MGLAFSHVSVLVLEVRLPVVADDPVGVGARRRFLIRAHHLTPMHVVEALEETLAQIHVADRVDALGELTGAGQLAVPVAPVVLNAFEVPLIHNNDDLFPLGRVDLLEELLILLVDEDLLQVGEVLGSARGVPVHEVLVHALLREGAGASEVQL